MFRVQYLQPLLRIHAAERGLACVGSIRVKLDRSDIWVAHGAQGRGEASAAELRSLPSDLELLEPVLVHDDAQGPLAVFRFEIGLPQVRRLQNVPIGVDPTVERERLRLVHRFRHWSLPWTLARRRISTQLAPETRCDGG